MSFISYQFHYWFCYSFLLLLFLLLCIFWHSSQFSFFFLSIEYQERSRKELKLQPKMWWSAPLRSFKWCLCYIICCWSAVQYFCCFSNQKYYYRLSQLEKFTDFFLQKFWDTDIHNMPSFSTVLSIFITVHWTCYFLISGRRKTSKMKRNLYLGEYLKC